MTENKFLPVTPSITINIVKGKINNAKSFENCLKDVESLTKPLNIKYDIRLSKNLAS